MTTFRTLRKSAGFKTQQNLADCVSLAVPVSRVTVTAWELGTRRPEHDALVRLAEIFHKPLIEMYEMFYGKTNEQTEANKNV